MQNILNENVDGNVTIVRSDHKMMMIITIRMMMMIIIIIQVM
jgi:hypothetical protein